MFENCTPWCRVSLTRALRWIGCLKTKLCLQGAGGPSQECITQQVRDDPILGKTRVTTQEKARTNWEILALAMTRVTNNLATLKAYVQYKVWLIGTQRTTRASVSLMGTRCEV